MMHEEWDESDERISKLFRVELVLCSCGCNGKKRGPTIEANVGETIIIRLVNHLVEPMTIDLADAARSAQPKRMVAPGATGEFEFVLVNTGRFNYGWGDLIVHPN